MIAAVFSSSSPLQRRCFFSWFPSVSNVLPSLWRLYGGAGSGGRALLLLAAEALVAAFSSMVLLPLKLPSPFNLKNNSLPPPPFVISPLLSPTLFLPPFSPRVLSIYRKKTEQVSLLLVRL